MDLNELKVSNYLEQTCTFVKNKRVHSDIKNELKSHIEKLTTHYEKLGHSEDESTTLALTDMGSSSKLGNELNNTHKPSFDFKLLTALVILTLIGFVGTLTFANYGGNFSIKNLIILPIILVVFFITSKISFRFYKKLSIPFYILGIVLYGINISRTGEHLLGIIPFNRYVYIPILILFGLSGIYQKLKFNSIKCISIAIILGLAPLALFSVKFLSIMNITITQEANTFANSILGSQTYFKVLPMVICYSIALLFVLYTNSKSTKAVITTGVLAAIIIVATSFNTFKAILNVNGWGWTSVRQILIGAGLVGSNTPSKINTAYPLTSLIGSYGWIVGIVVIAFLAFFIFRLYKSSFEVNNTFGKSLMLSISTLLAVNIIITVLMNLGILPYIYMDMPLVSFNGLSLLTTAALIGVLTNIYKVKTLAKI